MWKHLRMVLAVAVFAGCLLLFCDRSEGRRLALSLSWLADVQIVPALLAGSLACVAALLAATLLLGRVYCSTKRITNYIVKLNIISSYITINI